MKLRFNMALLAVLCLALSASAFAGAIFDDGPVGNGNPPAVYIDGPNPGPYSQSISDGFTATGSGTANYMTVGLWVPGGQFPTTLSWSLGTTVFGADISSGISTDFSYSLVTSNIGGWGYDLYTATITGLSGNFTAGDTYYLTLGNANDSGSDQQVAWDVNNGPASCSWATSGVNQGDCGSPYGGETFALYSGSTGGTVPEPSSLLLLGSGVLALAGLVRRRIGL